MVHSEVIRKRLAKLDEYLKILEDLRSTPEDLFLQTPEKDGSAERFLHLAIEAIHDMAAHVIGEEGWGEIEWQRDLPRLFLENHPIDPTLHDRWLSMMGFRNLLVHDDLEIDRRKVYRILQNHLSDLRELGRIFACYLS